MFATCDLTEKPFLFRAYLSSAQNYNEYVRLWAEPDWKEVEVAIVSGRFRVARAEVKCHLGSIVIGEYKPSELVLFGEVPSIDKNGHLAWNRYVELDEALKDLLPDINRNLTQIVRNNLLAVKELTEFAMAKEANFLKTTNHIEPLTSEKLNAVSHKLIEANPRNSFALELLDEALRRERQ